MIRKEYEQFCKQLVSVFLKNKKAYLRHVRKDNKIIGSVIAFTEGKNLLIGYSKCNKSDVYNRHIGIAKAINDAYKGSYRPIPYAIVDTFDRVFEHADSEAGRRYLSGH